MLLLLAAGLALAIVSGTEIVNGLLSAFSFEKGNGGRILGLAVFAIFILFLITLRALSVGGAQLAPALGGARGARLGGVPPGRAAGALPRQDRDPRPRLQRGREHRRRARPDAGRGLRRAPPRSLVVDDGSRDGTGDVAAEHGATVARHVTNRGGGAALRTGYRLMVESGAEIVVTLDADGQHLPSEMERLVKPVLDGEVDVAHGSRVLGHADRNHFARELGIVFFNRLVSFITRTHVTDCSNGYRAVRTTVLPQLVLRQEQFHTSEFMIEAIKRGDPRQGGPDHGRTAPPRPLEEAGGLPLRRRLRQRDRPHLAALSAALSPRLLDARVADRRRVGQVEVGAAARADLDVELQRLRAVRALAFGFVLLDPVEDHRDQAEQRQHRADQQPDPERAALALPMMPVARPKKKAMTRYSTPSILAPRLACPARPYVQAGARPQGAPTGRRKRSGSPIRASQPWRFHRPAPAQQQESGARRKHKHVWKDKHWRWVEDGQGGWRKQGYIVRHKHKPKKQPQARARASGRAAPRPPRPPSTPTRAPPGTYQGPFGREQATRLLNRAGFGPDPGPGRAARLDGPAGRRPLADPPERRARC